MRTVQVVITEFDGTAKTHEIGTNERDGGLFARRPDGSWSQFAGNGQTPTFRTPAQMMSYLRRNHYPEQPIRMVRGSAQW